jgi:repressor LexA
MFSHKNLFVLEVSGDSMIDAQIADGDFVVVRKQRTARDGQITVVQTEEGEATLKRFYLEKNRIRLEPANPDMKPIYVKHAKILGVVVGVVRKVE